MIEDLVSEDLIDGYVGTDFYVYIDENYVQYLKAIVCRNKM